MHVSFVNVYKREKKELEAYQKKIVMTGEGGGLTEETTHTVIFYELDSRLKPKVNA
jgi:hypothetical protein